MKNKSIWIAGLAAPVMIGTLLLLAGSRNVSANDQAAAGGAAIKIDNFVFGPQTMTVPVGTTVT
jgi:plastocyanin